MLRYHLDEHVDHAIAEGLALRGIGVTTCTDAGLIGASDEELLTYAWRESRVIFTNDDDFLVFAASGQTHAGVVYCAVGARGIGYLIEALSFLSDELEQDEMINRIEYVRTETLINADRTLIKRLVQTSVD